MKDELAFIGDLHGNATAARAIVGIAQIRGVEKLVFLGDYINKGDRTADVMAFLIELWKADAAVLLMGNHEAALLDALDTGIFGPFLRMGGAATIKSYVNEPVGPDVLGDFLKGLPPEHLEAFRAMPQVFEIEGLVARHAPIIERAEVFKVSAHVNVGARPKIGDDFAMIDTGCGDDPAGRLTIFFWPSRTYLQVDMAGKLI